MNEEEPQFNTDAQRRALDVMSARLLDNLNAMIAEQEARVQEFSRQQSSLSPLPMEEMTPVLPPSQQPRPTQSEHTVASKAWEQIPVTPAAPKAPARRSVTPPPVKAKKHPQPHYNVPKPPLPKGTAAMNEDEKKEASFGCGSLSVAIVVIIILLRACS